METKRLEGFDVVIAGGGPCACVLAKDLAKAGKKVILIEKGGNSLKGIGTMTGMLYGGHMERAAFPSIWGKTIEGTGIVLGTGVGGGSYLYAGIAGMPDFDAFDQVGIDLRPYFEAAKKETWVSKTPDEFLGPVTKRMLNVTHDLGVPFEPAYRHINFENCQYGCKTAAFGCARHAKWMGNFVAEEAEKYGAKLQIHTKVRNLIVEDNVAVGVSARGVKDGQDYHIYGKSVVCAAGGPGSAHILIRSGVKEAGTRLFGDPSFGTSGLLPKGDYSMFDEHGTSISYMDNGRGVLFSSGVTWPRLFWSAFGLEQGLGAAIAAYKDYPRVVCMFNKIHDEGVGRITWGGRISKTLTPNDELKMNYCRWINEKILTGIGCDPHTFRHTAYTFGHPGGSCSIGVAVDSNLETSIKNCFVCDISAMPGAPSRPPVLTLVTLTKWFVPRLIERIENGSP